jgi:VWFA-related protein
LRRNHRAYRGLGRSALTLLLASLTLATATRLYAQNAAAPITVTTRLVVLDVVVTDAKGKPVDGLTEKDFQVYEDNKLQRIHSLEAPSAHSLPPSSAGIAEVFDPSQPANFGRSPVTVLLLDQANTHFADSSFARRQIHDYLAKQPALLNQPTTLLSVYDLHFKQLQAFTRDRDALLKALASAPTEYAWKLETNGAAATGPLERLDQSLRALEEIAQDYARIPGRKNLVWVGGGFPTPDINTMDSDDAREVRDTLQHVTNVLLDTRVTLYAVDPSSTLPGMSEIVNETDMAVASATSDSIGSAINPFGSGAEFDALAPVTGGRVVRSRNDVAVQIADSVDLGANYYTLSYSPTSTAETDVKYRNIKVLCLRPGLTATTRSGYFTGQSKQERSSTTAAYDLSAAVEGPMPLNGLRVTAVPDTSASAPPDTYIVQVGASELTWTPKDDGSSSASVYIVAATMNAKQKMIGHEVHPMKATAKAGVDLHEPTRLADFIFTAPPTSKATTLRFVVRDSATGRMGSFDLPIHKH